MSEKKLVWNEYEYEDVEDYLQNGIIELDFEDFSKFKDEMIENHCQGFYIINTTLEDDKKCSHKYLFIERTYNTLICIPIKIPKENMLNTEKNILKVEYYYEPFKKSNYHTKRDELVDFDGKIVKKGQKTKTVTVDGVNYKIKPEKDYDLKKYLKAEVEDYYFDEILPEQYELMKKYNYNGLYEIRLVLVTGEIIHLYYYHYSHDDEGIKIYPLLEYNQQRNMHNIPKKYICSEDLKFYPKSKKLGLNKYYHLNNFKHYTNHMYENINEGEYIAISTSNFTNDVLSLIKQYGNKGKVIYSFEIEEDDSTLITEEIYEFVKFKKEYQYIEDFVILKTICLPEYNWYETELTDILSEKWDYVLD